MSLDTTQIVEDRIREVIEFAFGKDTNYELENDEGWDIILNSFFKYKDLKVFAEMLDVEDCLSISYQGLDGVTLTID